MICAIGSPLQALSVAPGLVVPATARSGLRGPGGRVAIIIGATLLARLIFAAMLGLGVDESYMVAAGRELQLSYFDHPPLAWWLSWGITHLLGTDSAFAVRLPFIALFAASTLLIFRLGAALFSAEAGFWTATAFNLAPVFGVAAGSWVLPDGPMDCALLGFALCLARALQARGAGAWIWWLAAGLCAGLALLSKYLAALVLAGGAAYLLTAPRHRFWLARPQPWAAALLAALLFTPVIVWNIRHGWASFAFQGGRAGIGAVQCACSAGHDGR